MSVFNLPSPALCIGDIGSCLECHLLDGHGQSYSIVWVCVFVCVWGLGGRRINLVPIWVELALGSTYTWLPYKVMSTIILTSRVSALLLWLAMRNNILSAPSYPSPPRALTRLLLAWVILNACHIHSWLPWLISESRVTVNDCWSILERAHFLLLARLISLITDRILSWGYSLGSRHFVEGASRAFSITSHSLFHQIDLRGWPSWQIFTTVVATEQHVTVV